LQETTLTHSFVTVGRNSTYGFLLSSPRFFKKETQRNMTNKGDENVSSSVQLLAQNM
jgi:hypothetical protein